MDLIITLNEINALSGLLHIQQLAYLRGIRPYMDIQTRTVGIKRRISHQSISETLYVEPKPGIKETRFSRDQVRRALAGLERAGLIICQSDRLHLILNCPLAKGNYSVQNKTAILPPSQPAIDMPYQNSMTVRVAEGIGKKDNIGVSAIPATPLKDNNYYIFLSQQFEKFWALYPVKKSHAKAWQVFQALNPTSELITNIFNALHQQIEFTQARLRQGLWVPNWKNPDNWLTQQCWTDELSTDTLQEMNHATHTKTTRQSTVTTDLFCPPDDTDDEDKNNNVLQFRR